MKFTKRNIQRINRNGEANNFSYSTSTSKAARDNSTSKGNFLPAIYNGDGSYVVDVTKVLFKGNITAEGEMTAHKQGTDGEISGGQIVVYDGLDSTDSTIALSANQGRILKGLISSGSGSGSGSADLSNYYDIPTMNNKLKLKADKSWVTDKYQPKGNYLTTIPSEYITEVELTNKGYITSSSLNGYAKTNQIPTKVSQLTNDKNYLTNHQSITHLANKNGSNASGNWGINIKGNAATSDISTKLNVVDNRTVEDKPRAKKQGLYADLKQNSTNGLKDGGTFNSVLTIRGYGEAEDFTGGYPHQLAFTDNNNIWTRRANDADSWKGWNMLWHTGNFNPSDKVDRIGKYSIYTSDAKPYNYVHLFRIANTTAWSCVRLDIDFKSRYDAAKLFLDIICNGKTFGNAQTSLHISQICPNDRKAEFYVKQTIQSKDYNYYDVYYKCGSWNMGSYDIINQGKNGTLVFEAINKRLEALPEGATKVKEKFSVNGNITATGEITAYSTNAKTLEETPMTIPLVDEEPRVYDGLDSTEPLVSLSANQGRILLNMINDLKDKVDNLQKQIDNINLK